MDIITFASEYAATVFREHMKLSERKWRWTKTFEIIFAHPKVCPLAFLSFFLGVFCRGHLRKLVDVRGLFSVFSRAPWFLRGKLTSLTNGGGELVFRFLVSTCRSCSLCMAASLCHFPLRQQQTVTHLLTGQPWFLSRSLGSETPMLRLLMIGFLTKGWALCIRSDMPLSFKLKNFLLSCTGQCWLVTVDLLPHALYLRIRCQCRYGSGCMREIIWMLHTRIICIQRPIDAM